MELQALAPRWYTGSPELLALTFGAKAHEGAGSRVRFVLDGSILSLHRPHPMRKYAVEDVWDFLAAHGIEPEEN